MNNALSEFFNDPSRRTWTSALLGPAIALPGPYKVFELDGLLGVEYLQSGSSNKYSDDEGEKPRNKNHVVFSLAFKHPTVLTIKGVQVQVMCARVSMDLATTENDNALDEIDLNRDYYPGTLNVKLLEYYGQSTSANERNVFSGLTIATLGDFIDFITNLKIHEMSFLGYKLAWKGCRHFIAQTYLQLRAQNKVSELDQAGYTLKDNITKVHHKDSSSHDKLIDRGLFLTYRPIYPEDFADAYEQEAEETTEQTTCDI